MFIEDDKLPDDGVRKLPTLVKRSVAWNAASSGRSIL
jgi:hypothetical protein